MYSKNYVNSIDFSILYLSKQHKEAPLSLGVLFKKSYSKMTIFEKNEGSKYYGHGLGNSIVLFPFLSTKLIDVLHPIKTQMQVGYLYSYSQTEANLMNGSFKYHINEAHHGVKYKATISLSTILGLSYENFVIQNGQNYVNYSVSISFNF